MRLSSKLDRIHKRVVLAAKMLTGRWSADVARKQAQLEAAIAHPPDPSGDRLEAGGISRDLEAVLVHSALAAMEVERLAMLYASLVSRVASLERASRDAGKTTGS